MATNFGGASVGITLRSVLQNVLDGRTPEDLVSFNPNVTLTHGTGANQANAQFFDRRTLAASATEDIDLAGGLTDAFGNALVFTKIRAIGIQALATNTNNVLLGGAASNQLATLFGAVNDVIVVRPGGLFLVVAPDAAGYAVTAATGDLLKIANSAGSTGVTFDIAILGTV